MKTKIYLTALLVFLTSFYFAQDTICKTNGSKIIAKVTEINSATIKYKFMNNGGELLAEVAKSEIAYVVYAGGLKEIYNPIVLKKETAASTAEPAYEPVPKSKKNTMNNIIAVNCFDMFFTNLTVSYERFFKDGTVSIKIPVSVGLGGRPNETNYSSSIGTTQFLQNKIGSAGLEINAYPFGRTNHTFYVGISGVAGSFTYYRNIYTTYGSGSYYQQMTYIEKRTGMHYAGMLHIGGNLGLSEHILVGAKFGLGFKREETVLIDYTLPKAQLDLNLAYRF